MPYNENLDIPIQSENETCPAVGYQKASICVPIEVKPFAKTGVTVTKCCGKPKIKRGKDVCEGEKEGSCFFTISQEICVAVPVEFGAEASVGDAYIDCIDASVEDICVDCDNDVDIYDEEHYKIN